MTFSAGRDLKRLLSAGRPMTADQDRVLVDACHDTLAKYRTAALMKTPSRALTMRARLAYLHLGGDVERRSISLKDYDHIRFGPFLGVSDEGSAAGAIRDAALASPKAHALPKSVTRSPFTVGVAVDAERLGGVGEVAVGPEEYADIWLACVGRVLVTTNVGTRVNLRVYRREPRIMLRSDSPKAIADAKVTIAAAFRPFLKTPDLRPRPLTVFVEIPRFARMTFQRKKSALSELARFVASGRAAGTHKAQRGHAIGLAARVGGGLSGKASAVAAIELASSAGISVVILDGARRKPADAAISFAGLLDYFPPGIVGPLLRLASQKHVTLRAANLPDTDTIARSIWAGLTTARNMGADLGKYGCFPLTRPEMDHVVRLVQGWMPAWSAAPVFFVDQGLLREGAIDVERDLPRGIEIWLDTVAAHGVRIVLIDTIDKATGRKLLRKSSSDNGGYLGTKQIKRIEIHARRLGVKVLWAGGLGLRDAFEMGKLGVFGIYVTSAAATTIPVSGSYVRDPGLAGVKEPSKDAVLRTKVLLEAGFLAARLEGRGLAIDRAAERLLRVDEANLSDVAKCTTALALACTKAWPIYWKVSGQPEANARE